MLVTGVVTDLDRAQSVEDVVDKEQDFIIAFPGITNHLGDLEVWKTTTEGLEARDGQEMVVTIGCGKGSRKGPEGKEAVVDEIKGLVFVAEMMLAPSRGRGIG